jgi:hypothetical protein
MTTPNNTTSLARFQEVAQGTGPVNAAAWVASGVRHRHIMESLDLSAFKQTVIEDERSQEDVQAFEQVILGIKGGIEFPHEEPLHGLEDVAADGDPVVANELATFLTHCMGGIHLSRRTTATGGTTTTAILTVDTDVEVGCHFWVEQGGRRYPRRVVAFNGGTNTVTFDEALPAAVANGDVLYGAATLYFDEDALNDSSVGPTTWSWYLSQGRGSAREHWEANGCKSSIESISLPRNAAPKLAFKTLVASFDTPDDLADPTWTTEPEGAAPVAVGPRTHVSLNDYGSTVSVQVHGVEVAIKPGGAPSPIDTGTELQTGMPGRAGYGLTRDKATATFKTIFDSARFADFTAGTLLNFRWHRDGGAGRLVAVGMPRCQIAATPATSPAGPSMGMELELEALKDTTAIGTTDLARSRVVVVLG